MFTGIVEVIGTVIEYKQTDNDEGTGGGVSLTIGDSAEILTDVHLGDSISTNGVCLTVTHFDKEKGQFKVGIAPETLRRTNLGDLRTGSKVNLERAVSGETRLGGHIVQGHVDTIATITKKSSDENALNFTFQLRDPKYIHYVVEKGFIAVDGTSLTVTDVDYKTAEFSVMLVSYTQGKVVISQKKEGDTVNIEVDLTGKLIEQQIELVLTSQLENDGPLANFVKKIVDQKLSALGK
ncbi:Piso0_004820 [Millerozyma farinosa CBS 7064]|uniref:Riboflavin synthase n=1 Tax=Pichia sorbitophila (strain ATCC MYA-4447 / BCRC 22081 / CBS 7064 / NBRC 10061 / NRRL Y-12695) TaxID=559304 RepID=G8Y0I4_PICSO|nr:Piso0_004820 [Millerozyma farinosa CBS 7064]